MTERTFNRVSPLQDVAVQGRFGADKGAVGVNFTVRHPMSIVTVIADLLGVGEGTVRKQLARAREQLRRILDER